MNDSEDTLAVLWFSTFQNDDHVIMLQLPPNVNLICNGLYVFASRYLIPLISHCVNKLDILYSILGTEHSIQDTA